jgi:hypothetical protein
MWNLAGNIVVYVGDDVGDRVMESLWIDGGSQVGRSMIWVCRICRRMLWVCVVSVDTIGVGNSRVRLITECEGCMGI